MNKEKLIEIIEYSQQNNISEKESCEKYGENPKIVYYYKKKYNLLSYSRGKNPNSKAKRKHEINDYFFSNITLLTCYYAGFIAADGNIYKNNLTISLARKDRKILERFLTDCKSNYLIKDFLIKNRFEASCVTIVSKQIIDDLYCNFNIIPNKSLTLQSPNLKNKEAIDAFIIGYIDGDGSISYSKIRNELQISLIGTNEMLSWIKLRFEEILNDNVGNLYHKSDKNTWELRISNKKARTIFLHLYCIDVPKLERKWSTEKHKYSINFTKKRSIDKYKTIYKMLNNEKLTQQQVANNLGISQAAISWYTKQEIYKMLDKGEADIESNQ